MKNKSIFMAILFSGLGTLLFLKLIPKLIIIISSSVGLILDSGDLSTKYIVGTSVRMLGVILFIAIMKKIDIARNISFRWSKNYALVSWLFLVYIIFNIEFVVIQVDKIPLVLLMIISCFGVALFEEVLFRGLVLGVLLKTWNKNKIEVGFSVLFSSLLFGMVHILNFISGKSGLIETLCQVGYTMFIGVVLAAILLRCHFSLWWCVLLHGLFNIANEIGKVASNTEVISATNSVNPSSVNYSGYVINMLLMVPLLGYGLFLMRKVKSVDQNFEIVIK